MLRLANETGLLLPAMDIRAPFLKVLNRIVLSPSRIFGSPIKERNAGVPAIIGASLSTLHALAISKVG